MIAEAVTIRRGRLAAWVLAGFALLVPPAARAQEACPSGAAPRGHLGITIACDCTVGASWESDWTFRSPILVRAVERNGPAYGILWPGDEIVAVNDVPVTSEGGSRILETLRPGQRVRLTVRRDGDERTVRVTAREICPHDPRAIGTYVPEVPPDATAGRRETPAAAPPARREAPAGPSREPVPVPERLPDVRPEGWLGVAFACTGCGWAREADDATPYWESDAPPLIYAVYPGGPAERAGLRPGDLLLAVDGEPIESEAAGRVLGAVRPGERVRLRVRRDGEVVEHAVEAERRPELGGLPGALRYAGELGGVRVEVSGDPPDDVAVTSDGGELVIVVGGTVIRLSAPPR